MSLSEDKPAFDISKATFIHTQSHSLSLQLLCTIKGDYKNLQVELLRLSGYLKYFINILNAFEKKEIS